MADLTIRGYVPTDADALTALLNLIEDRAGGHGGLVADDVRAMTDAMVADPATDTRLLFAPDGALVAASLVATPPDGGFRVDVMAGVHPDWRGRGIGRELMVWQVTRAREIHDRVAPDREWEVHLGAVVGDEPTIRLFERAGLTPVRYWLEMVAHTSDVPTVPLPDGFSLATIDAGHERALYEAHEEAFADHWAHQRRGLDEWLALTLHSDNFVPALSLVALDGAEVAGYVLAYHDAAPERVYIGQVGVRRNWRRRGLAAAVLVEALRRAASAGKKSAALGVDAASPTGAVGVYERAGFGVEYRAVTYAQHLPG